MFDTPRSSGDSDHIDKNDLVGALCVFKIVDYDPMTSTMYGVAHTVTCELIVVDGPHAGHIDLEWFAAGNLAKQIGSALDVGQIAPGRIVKGEGNQGRIWFGVDWALTSDDIAAAEAAVTAVSKPTGKPTIASQLKADKAVLRAARGPVSDAAPF